jgi:hypothetical protein
LHSEWFWSYVPVMVQIATCVAVVACKMAFSQALPHGIPWPAGAVQL